MNSAKNEVDHREEHPQADFAPARGLRIGPASRPSQVPCASHDLVVSRRAASHQTTMPASSATVATTRFTRGVRGRVRRSCRRRAAGSAARSPPCGPARRSRRPSGRRPAAPVPSCRACGGVSGVCHSSVVARQGLPPAGLPCFRLQTRLNRKMSCAAATTSAAMRDGGVHRLRRIRDEVRVAHREVAARHAEDAEVVHRQEDRVRAEERDPEVQLAERLVRHAAGDLRVPVVDRAATRPGPATRPSPCGSARRRSRCPTAARPP